MQTIEIQKGIRVGFEDMVNGAAKMDTDALERFRQQISLLLARRKTAPMLSVREAELLSKINESVGEPALRRQRDLMQRMKKSPLPAAEQEELSRLIDEIEARDATRLENLLELAQLRGTTLDALMAQLGISISRSHA